MEVQAAISQSKLKAKVGRTMTVLVDEVTKGGSGKSATVMARSAADAPEIDGVVHVRGAKKAQPGEFLQVRITASTEHDLEAELVT